MVSVSAIARAGTGPSQAGAALSPGISVFVEDLQLMSCQNSTIIDRALTPSRQTGQNGRDRPAYEQLLEHTRNIEPLKCEF